jgi:hypothetical protein
MSCAGLAGSISRVQFPGLLWPVLVFPRITARADFVCLYWFANGRE